jgi:RNA polymerase sigma factor (sigma-70 family)
MYNSATMMPESPESANYNKPEFFSPVSLFHRCASDREDLKAWREFLLKYSVKIKFFIRGTLRQFSGNLPNQYSPRAMGGLQESDLFQDIILRLVEHDCAAMKRFTGTTEDDLLAYMAVISRSTVIDALRRHKTIKRTVVEKDNAEVSSMASSIWSRDADHLGIERGILAKELISMIHKAINDRPGRMPARDQLVFKLRFLDGLSCGQIAQCQGINLSKPSVEKVLRRLIDGVQEALQPKKPRQC